MILALNPTLEKWLDPTTIITIVGALTALFVALKAMRDGQVTKKTADDANQKSDVNTQNIATNAAVSGSIIEAQRASPGPNVPTSVEDAARQVKETPTIPIEAPTETAPIVTAPTPEAVTRGFNLANPPPPDVT
jgi:cell division septation protein DedD